MLAAHRARGWLETSLDVQGKDGRAALGRSCQKICYRLREALCNPAVNSAWRVRPRSKMTNVPAASSSSATDKTGMKNAMDGFVEVNRIIANAPPLSMHTSSTAVAMLDSIRNRLRCLEY